MNGIFVFDIDGTLANNEHRQHHLYKEKRDWDGFFAGQHLDTVYEGVREILWCLMENGNRILFLTGRNETFREVTETWIDKYIMRDAEIIMRAEGCREDDSTLKVRLLEERLTDEERASIQTIFEDRKRVAQGLRAAGYHVCHVAEGDF